VLLRGLGHREGEAGVLDSLGYINHQLGDYHRAIACYQQSLVICRDLGDQYNVAGTLSGLGDAHHAFGDPDAAREAWEEALRILDGLDHPDAAEIRAKITQ
jgi:tetratricopeptide (TPR) repeat protein